MADSQKRELRVRKPPTYLNSDEEDADAVLRIRATCKKDVKQNQLQVGAMSKLLVKFVTQVNQQFRVAQKDAKKQKTDKQKKTDVPTLKSISRLQNNQPLNGKKVWTDQVKKQKQLPSLKNTSLSREQLNIRAGQKGQTLSANTDKSFISYLYACQDAQGNINLDKLTHKFPELNQYIDSVGADKLQKHIHDVLEANGKSIQSKKQESAQRQKTMKKNLSGNQQKNVQGNNPVEQFKFKRAAYHIAIAYHIHVKRIESNPTKVDIDPTAFAKKLRQQRMSPCEQRQVEKVDQNNNKNL